MALHRFTGLWRNADFLKLWTGQTISMFGTMIGGSAMDFTAILFLQASPIQVAVLAACRQVPAFLAGLVVGAWVDRQHRRPVLIATDLGRALALVSVPVAAAFGQLHIEQLYIVAFATSLLTLFFDVAYQAYLPSLVRRDELLEGNSKLTASASVAEFGGFSLAGWLVSWLSGPLTILIDAVSFLVSATSLWLIRGRESRMIESGQTAVTGMLPEVREGLRLVASDPILRVLALTTMVHSLSGGCVGAVIVLYMTRDLGFAPGILGMMWAVGGVTSFLGALVAAPVAHRLGTGGAMVAGLLVMAGGTFLVPLAEGTTLLSAVLLVANQLITDPAATVYNINETTLRQSIVPDRLLGRVGATLRFLGLGLSITGAVVGGALGETLGVRVALIVGAGGGIVSALVMLCSPLRKITTPRLQAPVMADL